MRLLPRLADLLTTDALKMLGAGADELLLIGPLVWGFIRQRRGLPAFDNNLAAWRLPERTDQER